MTRRKILLSAAALIVVGALGAYLYTRPEPADTRFTGAYTLDDGSLALIAPREGKVLRYRLVNGESGALWPTKNGRYEGGAGWAEREPVVNVIKFDMDAQGRPTGFAWQRSGKDLQAHKLALAERIATFPSGDITLRGKLVLPSGQGAFPAVVFVHGSEATSAVDHYAEPYLQAANGFAGLAFDKRGTGESEGDYLQNFHVLADDVVAAVRWLRTQPEIDPDRIHLAGFSQGGWIAPLAALKDGNIRSVLVGYGVMVPVTGEDRWGYVHALREKGLGADAIAAADRVNAVIEDLMDRRLDRWDELADMLDASRDEPWFAAVRGSDSALGLLTDTKLPIWMMRTYVWWRMGEHRDPPFIDRLYDPVPTMQQLDVPSLWLLAGQDSSAPAAWTVDELKKLQAAGKPVQYFVFPEAEHGILRFVAGENGERRILGLEPDYYPKQLAWFREHGGS